MVLQRFEDSECRCDLSHVASATKSFQTFESSRHFPGREFWHNSCDRRIASYNAFGVRHDTALPEAPMMNKMNRWLVCAAGFLCTLAACTDGETGDTAAEADLKAPKQRQLTCTGADIRSGVLTVVGALAACGVDKSHLYCPIAALGAGGNTLINFCEKGCLNYCTKDANLRPGTFRCDTQPETCAERDSALGFVKECTYYDSLKQCKSACGKRKGYCVTGAADGTEYELRP
jgi:hypothetical protein